MTIQNDIHKKIKKRTTQCLIHRYLYYVKASPLVSDAFYDNLERELRELVKAYPAEAKDVPFVQDVLNSPGSDLIDSYARLVGIEELAESLLKYAKRSVISPNLREE